jgi:hypothetical protein
MIRRFQVGALIWPCMLAGGRPQAKAIPEAALKVQDLGTTDGNEALLDRPPCSTILAGRCPTTAFSADGRRRLRLWEPASRFPGRMGLFRPLRPGGAQSPVLN